MLKKIIALIGMSAAAVLPVAAGAWGQATDAPTSAITTSAVHGAAALVPGATNPNVTQTNISTTVCVSGWTTTIRPPASYTNKLKLKQMQEFGLAGSPHDYEEDHLISLEIGGNPTSEQNLWPQPWHGANNAHLKDRLENRLKKLVCNHTITLEQAQTEISTDWRASYEARIGPMPANP